MTDAVTDTHGLIWYLENNPHLSDAASKLFDACDQGQSIIYVPTICLVELIYLQEKGRISSNLKQQFDEGLKAGTSGLVIADLTQEVVGSLAKIPRTAVPELPDRIIAATALHLGVPLISRDHVMQEAGLTVIW
jgi:PIN domain nuclease of toxin-antitoxin system